MILHLLRDRERTCNLEVTHPLFILQKLSYTLVICPSIVILLSTLSPNNSLTTHIDH